MDKGNPSSNKPAVNSSRWWNLSRNSLAVVTIILAFTLFRDTVFKMWMNSGKALEDAWATIYLASGENDFVLFVFGSWGVSFTTFVVMNLMFALPDIARLPSFVIQYKIQKKKNIPMDVRKFLKATCLSIFNMTVVVFAMLLIIWYTAAKNRMDFGYELPTFWTVLKQLLFCAVFHDIGFYYIHRLMHYSPLFYKHVHKLHHEWTAPCAMATFDVHPIEQALLNLTCFSLGPALCRAHLATAWLFWMAGNILTTLAHSGYHLPFLPSSEAHDYHHHRGRDYYSTLGFLDWIHGTNSHFSKSVNGKRHFILCGLTPADELVK